jgi:hypothetical protein
MLSARNNKGQKLGGRQGRQIIWDVGESCEYKHCDAATHGLGWLDGEVACKYYTLGRCPESPWINSVHVVEKRKRLALKARPNLFQLIRCLIHMLCHEKVCERNGP